MSSVGQARCDVCLDDYSLDQFRVLVCGHTFCIDCTTSFSNTQVNFNPKCPKCRTSLSSFFGRGQKSVPLYLTLSEGSGTSDTIDWVQVKDRAENIQTLVESLTGHDGTHPGEMETVNSIQLQTSTLIALLHLLASSDPNVSPVIGHLTSSIKDLFQTLYHITASISHLKETLQIAESERDAFLEQFQNNPLNDSLRALEIESRELSAKVASAEAERDGARDAYAKVLQSSAAEKHTLQMKLEHLQEQIADLQEAQEAAAISDNHLRERNAELGRQAAVLQRKVDELEEVERGWGIQREAMQQQESSVRGELQAVRLERDTAMSQARKADELAGVVQDLQRKLAFASRPRSEPEASTSRQAVNSEISALRSQVEILESDLQLARSQLTDRDGYRASAKEMQLRVKDLEFELSTAGATVKRLRARAQASTDAATRDRDEIQNLREKITALEADLAIAISRGERSSIRSSIISSDSTSSTSTIPPRPPTAPPRSAPTPGIPSYSRIPTAPPSHIPASSIYSNYTPTAEYVRRLEERLQTWSERSTAYESNLKVVTFERDAAQQEITRLLGENAKLRALAEDRRERERMAPPMRQLFHPIPMVAVPSMPMSMTPMPMPVEMAPPPSRRDGEKSRRSHRH